MAYANERYADPYVQSHPQQTHSAGPELYDAHSTGYHGHPLDPQAEDYPGFASTDKIISEGAANGTQRQRKGRQGLAGETKSWGAAGPPPRSTGILSMWRKDERGKQWSRGGGCRVFLRAFCCCMTLGIIIALSVILTILLYVRPPSVQLDGITVGTTPVSLSSTGLNVNFAVGLSVSNPNWFSINFEQIKATVTYPGVNSGPLGGGTLNNADFKGYTESSFQFPLAFNYTLASDPNRVIINDLASKCGATGGSTSDITIDYRLDLNLKVLGVTVKPGFSSSASFACPISSDQIKQIIGSVS